MKCLSIHHVVPSLMFVLTALSSATSWSMDELSDSQLATTTGQDGITLLIAPPTLTTANKATVAGGAFGITQSNGLIVGAALLHDKDGFSYLNADGTTNITYSGLGHAGALIFGDASQANAVNTAGVQMGVFASSPIAVTIDASNGLVAHGLGGTSPVLNINIALPSDLLIRTGDISIGVSNRTGIAVGAAGATVANAAIGGISGTAYKIMNSTDIALGVATSVNIQLGNTPQGGLLTLSSFNIPSLNFGISLASPNGGAVASANLTASVAITNLNLTGTKVDSVQDMGLALGGSSTGIGGLIVQNSSLTIGGLQLNNITTGLSGNSDTTFGGMQNAPMGSFGITNMTVSNLKIGVSGM
jgi:hypothetical protein